MKRREIIKRIRVEARRQGVSWEVGHEGTNHTIFRLGRTTIPIPRHREVGFRLTETILKQSEEELGARWWR